jgi:hypothetical protein
VKETQKLADFIVSLLCHFSLDEREQQNTSFKGTEDTVYFL